MRQTTGQLSFQTPGRGLVEITSSVAGWVGKQAIELGLLTLFCRHTSASLLIQENADPDVRRDLEKYFEQLVPESRSGYRHAAEGPDDMPGHIRTALTQTQFSVPVIGGRMALGTWQGLFLFEHRTSPHSRTIALHLVGE
jgi:secondary thiamine-phosphate synthase enzyme